MSAPRAAEDRRREGLEPQFMPDRVMVCASTSSPRVIRDGARIATRLDARWYAVYVETQREAPGVIAEPARATLDRNLALNRVLLEVRSAVVQVVSLGD